MKKEEGLIGAYLLRREGGRSLAGWEDVTRWRPEEGVLWVHMDRDHPSTRAWLEGSSGLKPLEVEALLAEETRPRVAAGNGTLLVLLRGVNLNPDSAPEDMVSIRLWSDGRRIVSTRLRRLFAVQDLGEEIGAGNGPATAGAFIAALNAKLVYNMEGVVEELKDEGDSLEERLITEETHAQHRPISELRRHAVILRRYLAPQREAVARLETERVEWLSEEDRIHLRETADSITRYLEDLDALKDRAAILREELSGRLSERMERRMYSLSVIATLFLPLTFITGLLGINVGGIPGAENPLSFALVSGLLLVALAVQAVLMRWRGWF